MATKSVKLRNEHFFEADSKDAFDTVCDVFFERLSTSIVPAEAGTDYSASKSSDSWSTAVKIQPGEWQIHEDGQNVVQSDSDLLDENKWTVVTCTERAFSMNDKSHEKARKSVHRRKKELDTKVEDVVRRLGKQQHEKNIKTAFETHMEGDWFTRTTSRKPNLKP